MSKERKVGKIQLQPDDKIDNFCYEIVSTLYPETGPGALLTNQSTLNDFVEQTDIPGHELRRLADILKAERKHYQNDFKALKRFLGPLAPERYLVWYPPVSEVEWEVIEKQTRKSIIQNIERVYDVSLVNFPEDLDLFVWKVAEYVSRNR